MNRVFNVAVPDDIAQRLERLARSGDRPIKHQAERLLIEAVRRGDTDPLEALAAAFEAEGHRLFDAAESDSAGPRRRLVVEVRGETWFRAAVRLRAVIALPLTEARSALPDDDRPTAA